MLRDSEGTEGEEKRRMRIKGSHRSLFCCQENEPSRKTLRVCLTREEEEAALDRASDGLQFDYVHRLADVHRAGHAS